MIPVFIYSDPTKVIERLQNDAEYSYPKHAIDFRTMRNQQVWDEYLSQVISPYKETIINNSIPAVFHKFIEQLLMKYAQEKKDVATLVFKCGDIAHLGKPLIGHREKIDEFLSKNPYEKNIFLMIKYRDNNLELRKELVPRIKLAGYNCVIADENDLTNDVYNPIALTYCCKYGIALFDKPEKQNYYSPNVAYELGIMQSQGKNCLVVKHTGLKGANFFDILKNEGNWYETDLALLNMIDAFLRKL